MKELLEVIARNLVDDPKNVTVEEIQKDSGVTLLLKVPSEDMGKVIGKQGKIAKAIRSVVKSVAIHKNLRVNVDIMSIDEAAEAESEA